MSVEIIHPAFGRVHVPCFSNFHPARVALDGDDYRTVEHAYQAAKTLSPEWRSHIRLCESPGKAKRMGRMLPMRPGWTGMKLAIMESLLRQKFAYGECKQRLIASGQYEIVEFAPWGDQFWGIDRDGHGMNHLGQILMKIRSGLQVSLQPKAG
jgi:ribA/ribD-fused uncharacterized protein